MRFPFVIDPNTEKPSATLTLTMISFFAAVILSVFEAMGKVESTGVLLELFWGNCAMYLGRRFTFKGKNVEASGSKEENI